MPLRGELAHADLVPVAWQLRLSFAAPPLLLSWAAFAFLGGGSSHRFVSAHKTPLASVRADSLVCRCKLLKVLCRGTPDGLTTPPDPPFRHDWPFRVGLAFLTNSLFGISICGPALPEALAYGQLCSRQ